MLTANVAARGERKRALKAYLATNVLSSEFVCPNYEQCKSSHAGRFFEGQLHHVGNSYDLMLGKN